MADHRPITRLTDRQRAALYFAAKLGRKSAAHRLGLSVRTLDRELDCAYDVLGVGSLAYAALEVGIAIGRMELSAFDDV